MTINATAMWLLALYQVVAEEQGAPTVARAGRDDAERHHQGVPVARDLRVPARAVAAADHRHGRLHGRDDAAVEPDQHLQLPPAGGRARRRCRRSRTRCRTAIAVLDAVRDSGQVPRSDFGEVVAPHLLLRQRRRALRRGDVQDARLRAALGRADARALRRDRRQAAPVPLRRAGQLARPDRGAAGEQRPADRAGDARRDAVARTPAPARCSCRPGTRRSGCRGRGTSSGRCGSSRCWPTSPTCSSTRTSSPGRSSSRRRSPSSSRARGPRWPGWTSSAARSPRSSPAT